MPSLTPNYGLKKPLDNENGDIAIINENMDIIDAQLAAKGEMKKSVYDTNDNCVVDKAEKLNTARTITLSGAVTGSITFDGSANITIDAVLAALSAAKITSGTMSPARILQDASNRFMMDTERTKLSGIATSANNYSHPSTHLPSIIAQDANYRFTSDTEKTKWNSAVRGATIKIASNWATVTEKASADYVCDGTNDEIEILAAYTSLLPNGGSILLSSGTFNIAAPINFSDNTCIMLKGQGSNTILKRMYNETSTPSGLLIIFGRYCTFSDFKVDGNTKNYATAFNNSICVRAESCSFVNLWIQDSCGCGIYVSSINTTISNCRIYGGASDGVQIGNNNTAISSALVTGCIIDSNNVGINQKTEAYPSTFTGNKIRNHFSHGIYCSGNAVISGNFCYLNAGSGIQYANTGTAGESSVISGNNCSNNGVSGISVSSSYSVSVVGNTTKNNDSHGIYLYNSKNCNVTGNTCLRGTGLSTDYTTYQYTIYLSSTNNNYNLVADNIIMGKNYVADGGTANTFANNKYN